jgi:hypothetical protein
MRLVLHLAACLLLSAPPAAAQELRPPAVPLVTHDPYFSAWSTAGHVPDQWARHWTGAIHAIGAMVRIDGRPYRLMGQTPADQPMLTQKSVRVLPTRTIYVFEADKVELTLTFLTPALPHNLDVLARPITYVNLTARSTDGNARAVSAYIDLTAEWAVNDVRQPVTWSRAAEGDLAILKIGTVEQPVLAKTGDNLRIDWGYLHLAVPKQQGTATVIGPADNLRRAFANDGSLAAKDDEDKPRPASRNWPGLAATLDFGKVAGNEVSRRVMVAYDDEYGIEYMTKRLRPYWRRNNVTLPALLQTAHGEYAALLEECTKYDDELTKDLAAAGGDKYAQLAALSFRQCLAAHKLVADEDGTPLYFSKENFSNGCIATVDVTYPSSPFFLLLNPELLWGQTKPILDYARGGRWKFPFAPHDLGTYPKANGQVYGGGERDERDQMPVEECGNMLIMCAALGHVGRTDLVKPYMPLLTKWAEYLKAKGMDPENQLCTDDFAGHLAHNTNLSVKAIVALGAFAQLCEKLDQKDQAATYRKLAREMAGQWQKMADDGDHYRLTFDKPGTWSQKYNLVWDQLLGLNLFPPDVARKEIAYYKTKQNKYGLPLDSRKTYTKLDWVVWTATLADSDPDFRTLVEPLWLFAHETPNRVPLTDWYDTTNARQSGFQARSVVGGVYIKLLKDPKTWKKYIEKSAPRITSPPR